MAAQRDLRIDFLRGLALLIVAIDHLEAWAGRSVVESWTLISLGFSDAAEIFVFLSGYVFAVAYSGTLDRDGFVACLKKAGKRAVQIYAAYLIAAGILIAIGAALHDLRPPQCWDIPQQATQLRIGEQAGDSLLASLTLRFHPVGFDILAFYVLVLPVSVVSLWMLRRTAWLAWGLSAGAYVLAQFYPAWNFHRFVDNDVWFFNPLAWQFLFFIGVFLGDPQRTHRRIVHPALLMTASAAVLLFGLFMMKGGPWLVRWDGGWIETLRPLYNACTPWMSKTNFGPLRLVHFLALAYVTSRVLPRDLSFWSTRWARPLVVTGQNSLEVYACGLVLTFLAVFAISRGYSSTFAVLLFDLAACLGSIAFAYGIRTWKLRRKQPALAGPAPAPHQASASPRRHRAKPDRRLNTPPRT